MPIIGLTDRAASFPRIGILRKGAPKVSEKQPGRDLNDHFRLETDHQDVAEVFRRLYSDKPNHIRVMLMFQHADQNFEAWKEHHSAGALKRRCDGQICVQRLCSDGGYDFTPQHCVCATELAQADKKHLCRPVGRLKIVVPELARLGYLLVPTTSIHDIIELTSNLEAAEVLRGDLRGIPFVLSRRPRKVSTPKDDGGRARREKWFLSLEPAPEWVRLQITAMERAALPAPALALPAPANGASYIDQDTGEVFDGDEEEEDLEPLRAELKRARGELREAGGTPWGLTERQVLAMSAAELRADIDATWETIQTIQAAAAAVEPFGDPVPESDELFPEPATDWQAEYDAIEAAEATEEVPA